MERIYLDYNASTPIAPAVAATISALLSGPFGNPSSDHWASRPARDILEKARTQVARSIGAQPDEIIFTGGCTEANNLALKGSYYALRDRGNHIITQTTEHPAVLEPLKFLEREGARVTLVSVDRFGQVDPDAIRAAIGPDTILISVMHANNETGTVQPIEAIARVAREHGVRFHTDAAQTLGKLPVDVKALGVDLLSIAGHKLYAPKGVGALYVRRGCDVFPLIHGPSQEAGRRSGTENVLFIAALGTACELAAELSHVDEMEALRNYFWEALQAGLGSRVVLNGHPENRLPNTLNVSFMGQLGGALLARIPALAASTGSACHSGHSTVTPVLAAMGVEEAVGLGAIRFSLGGSTTRDEIDTVVARLIALTLDSSGRL